MNAITIAKQLLEKGVHESGGNNRGPMVDLINHEAGAPLGTPWCASTVYYCFHHAELEGAPQNGLISILKTASSQEYKHWFAARDWLSTNPQDLLNWKGAIAGWTDARDSKHGHVFMVQGRLMTDAGKVLAIQTIEGNSNKAGSREGQGVVTLKRAVPVSALHKLWYCRTDHLIGGSWW